MKRTKFGYKCEDKSNLDGERYVFTFENGYGANVVKNKYSYGSDEGLYELAVIDEDGLCFTTPITDDVIGFLQPDKVSEYLAAIEALEPRKNI